MSRRHESDENAHSSSYSPDDLRVLNLLKHPVWIFDIECKRMFWANHAALTVWNADSLESFLNRDFASDMSEAAESWLGGVLAKLTRNETIIEQWTFYPQGRGATTMDIACSAIRINQGGRIAMLVEAELPDKNALLESTVRGTEMLKHLPFAVSQFSIEGKLVYQNPEAVNLFGTTATTAETPNNTQSDETVADAFLSRFVDAELGKAALHQVQVGRDFSAEAQHHTLKGPRWFSIALRRTRDPVTSKYVILHSARDISDIIKARKDTTRAALKSEFMAVMAHEIRTPLHQMIGYLDLLALTPLSPEQLESINQVQSSTSMLMVIINDLLDYSKLECGHVQIESVSFALDGLLNSCLALIKPEADQKLLTLRSNIASDLPAKLVGDPNRLRQILLNLLSNAVKFTDKGYVSVTVHCIESSNEGHRLRFEVTDTGIGVAALEQKVIFEKYCQANASIARHYGGTGLGLAICKGLAELMGGYIGLDSEVGKGTTMFFEIPFQLAEIAKECTANGSEERASSAQEMSVLQVLVVEDNMINQKVMRSMLQRLGHTVTVAENGQLALDELRRSRYDLVLMDVQMPVMDGIECTKQIRGTLGLDKATLPVVGLTASFQHAELKFYQELGMTSCLGKPLRMEQLKEAISGAVCHGDVV